MKYINFQEKIKLLRNELGLTQEEASSKMGIAISSLRNYEGGRLPDSQQLKRIKEFYKVPYEYLLNDECNTREESNLRIGEKLGISDKSVSILKDLSVNHNANILEQLLEYIYKNNTIERIDEYIKIDYIIEIVLNDACPQIEKLIKKEKYSNITDEQIAILEVLIKYDADAKETIHNIEERNYFKFLMNSNIYEEFITNLKYIIPNIKQKSKIHKSEIEKFANYKKVKDLFLDYKSYFITNTLIHIDNNFIKQFNLKK